MEETEVSALCGLFLASWPPVRENQTDIEILSRSPPDHFACSYTHNVPERLEKHHSSALNNETPIMMTERGE